MESIVAKKIHTAPGMYVIVVEAEVEATAATTVYVSVCDDGANKAYTVAPCSIIPSATNTPNPMDIMEQYDELPTQEESAYSEVFTALLPIISILDA